MTLEQWAYVGDIATAIAVVASLIYVARQLKQNTHALLGQSRLAMLSASQTELFAQLENPDLAISIIKSEKLSAEDQVRLGVWLLAAMRARQFAWLQLRNKTIDRSQWQTEESVIRVIFDSARTRLWWARLGRVNFGDEYADFVDGIISAHPPTETVWQFGATWAEGQESKELSDSDAP